MKKIFTLLVALLSVFSAYAYDFKSGDLYYNITSTAPYTVEVTSQSDLHPYNEGVTITTVDIPESVDYNGTAYSVTSIGDYAFYNCSALTSITIPEGVTNIGGGAFNGCSSLTSITIPNSVTSVGGSAFSYCSSLTSIIIPNSVTSIERIAFAYCNALTSVTIPNSVASIGEGAFAGCTSLASMVVGSGNTTYDSRESCNAIIETATNTLIAGCKNTIIPNSVVSIGSSAFYECSSLTSITIPNGISSIGEMAFLYCNSLTSITIPESVKSIGDYAFALYEGAIDFITCEAKIPPTLGDYICVSSPICYIPCGTKAAYEASDWAQYASEFIEQCAATEDCIITYTSTDGNIVTPGKADAFGANIVSNVYENGEGTITFDAPLTSIGDAAFSGCFTFSTITIPNQVKTIGSNAFTGCTSLKGVDIPNSVTEIGSLAFYGCSELTYVVLSENITAIGKQTFEGCNSLESIRIPSGMTTIEARAFKDCISMEEITSDAVTPPSLGLYAFDNVSTSIPVYVPCGCVETYQKATRWKNFENIQEHPAKYKVTLEVDDATMGTATMGEKNTACGTDIVAKSNYGYHFVKWSDNVTDSVRTLLLTGDTTLTAYFAKNLYTITTKPNDANDGITDGDTTAYYLDMVTISASSKFGKRFLEWNDGNTANPREIQVLSDSLFIAYFEDKPVVHDTTYAYVCESTAFTHPHSGLSFIVSQDTVLVDTIQTADIHPDTISVYMIVPVVAPELMTDSILTSIYGVMPELTQGQMPDLDPAPIKNYYDKQDTEAIADVTNVSWTTTAVPCGATTHAMTLVVEDECGNTLTTTHVFNVASVSPLLTLDTTICYGEQIEWSGEIYDATGYYYDTLTSIVTGCDSIIAMKLVVHPKVDNVLHSDIICNDDLPYTWYGKTYDKTTRDSIAVNDANGCEYLAILDLVVLPKVHVAVTDTTVCHGTIFEWDVNGQKYDNSTDVSYILSNSLGCDSVRYELHLTVLDEIPETFEYASFDYGKSYQWPATGLSYNAEGTYSITLESVHGCDSIVTLVLTMNPIVKTYEYATIEAYICDGNIYYDPIAKKNRIITSLIPSTLTWNDTVAVDVQLDSVYTFNITPVVAPKLMTDSILASIYGVMPELTQGQMPDMDPAPIKNYYDKQDTEGVSDVINVSWTTTAVPCGATTHAMTLVVEDECDNLLTTTHVFNVASVSPVLVLDTTICYGEQIEWLGKIYDATGYYYDTLTSVASGCDSIVEMKLMIQPKLSSETKVVTCDSYEWNGHTYDASGVYTYSTTSASGCDSTATLHLTILPMMTYNYNVSVCPSELPYEWHGQHLTKSGTYFAHSQYAGTDCDSVEYILNLIVLQETRSEIVVEACDSYEWNGKKYDKSGAYTYTTTGANGCDSIVTLHLTINSSAMGAPEYVTLCYGETYEWNGHTYDASGTYTYTTTSANGCDSTATLYLTINPLIEGEPEYVTLCHGESYNWNGSTYDVGGYYTITLSNVAGCDSIASLHLIILPEMRYEYEEVTVCPSELPYVWHGQQLTEAGIYTDREQYTHYDCDRIENVLTLKVYDTSVPDFVTMPTVICGNPMDVAAATTDVEAYIAAAALYAPNASVTWQRKENGKWDTLRNEPAKGSDSEIVVRYLIDSDCGIVASDEMIIPVEMPNPENSIEMNNISIISRFGNRIFMLDINDFESKFGRRPAQEEVIWYKMVGAMDTYGEPGNDIVVGSGHTYSLPSGDVIVGSYYAQIEQEYTGGDDCASVSRSVVITATSSDIAPRLIPNVVRPNESLTIKNLDAKQAYEINVFSTTGELIASYNAENVSEFVFQAKHALGYYMVDVINENEKTTLRYVVK